MITSRPSRVAFQKRQWYRLHKLYLALKASGLKVKKDYHCVSVVTYEKPEWEKAKMGETVQQSLAINWTDEYVYVWYPDMNDVTNQNRQSSFKVSTVVSRFKSYVILEVH